MAKRTSKKSVSKRGGGRKPSASRKKVGAKKTATRKAAKRTTKRIVRKPAKGKATSRKVNRSSRGPTAKRPAASRARLAAPVAEPPRAPTAQAAAVSLRPTRTRSSRLNRKDLAQFRELLLAKRSELIGDVTTMQDEALSRSRQDATGDLSNMPIHMADLGTDNYEQEFTLGLIEGERALLREIDEALQRIANGTYGICQATGQPIGKARLRARPWAKYCYEYVLAQERGQQGSGF